jgi:hypothetical protein
MVAPGVAAEKWPDNDESVVGLVVASALAIGTWVAHPDGRVGPFRIDGTTEAQIRAVLGRPLKVENDYWPGKKGVYGRTLTYRCGPKCMTQYSINARTGKLSDYWSQSQRFVTEHGTRPGTTAREAAAREGKRPLRGGGFPGYIYLAPENRQTFVLAIWRGRIDSIGYLGPHTVYYEGLC